jgi:hypothetical protein
MRRKMKKKRMRTAYFIALLVLLCVEILIGMYVRDNFVRPYVGDVLVVVLIYCLIRVIKPTGVILLPLYVFVFACGVELLQLINIVDLLGIPKGSVVAIMIGSTFSAHDIFCYAAGCALVYLTELILKKHP